VSPQVAAWVWSLLTKNTGDELEPKIPATSLKRKRVWLPVFLENISLWLTISIVKESARSDPSFGSALSEGFCDFNQYIVL
jgi:hypothetical protein